MADLGTIAAIALPVLAFGYLFRGLLPGPGRMLSRLKRRLTGSRHGGGPRAEARALVHDCHGDQELAERLIFAEIERDESLTISAAARAARDRLKRDRND